MSANEKGNLPIASTASKRLNRLAAQFNCQTYLEIGICFGNTFFHVDVPHKTGVDPRFQFVTKEFSAPDVFYFEMKSNDFFGHMDQIQQQHYGKKILYDLIYIDGMHTFEQAMMDFVNTIPHSHTNTIWLFDDTVPCDPYSALPDWDRNQKYRNVAGLKPNYWNGDVYKCIFAIHDYLTEFSWCTTTNGGNPQTVVWKTKAPTQRKRIFPDMAALKAMDYFDLLDRCYVLNPVRDDEVAEKIGSNFAVVDTNVDKYLPKIVWPLRRLVRPSFADF